MSNNSSAPASGGASFGGSKHLSRRELEKEVRRDFHDKFGEHKGEQFFNMLSQHLDKDSFGSSIASGKEIKEMFRGLKKNNQDNIRSSDIEDAEIIVSKHFND